MTSLHESQKPSRRRGIRQSRGDRNIAWIERYLCIPEGKFVGQSVVLRPWQKKIIKGIYDRPTRRAIISFGRKNAKTTLSAFLLLLHLCGHEARKNSQLYSAAQSRDQAALLFGLAAKMVRLSPELSHFIVVRDTAKELLCPELGSKYRALSADATTAYGLSPVFIVHDELGVVKGPRSPLFEALETATGAQDSPLSLIISTQAPTDADLLSVLIDDAKTEVDPKVRLFIHTADPDIDPFSKKAIKQANPAFGDFLNAEEVLAMAQDARRMPSREAEFRNLVLNQRVEASSPFISQSVWAACKAPPKDITGVPVYGGLDLSSVNDLTALVLMGRIDGVWQVHPTFWLPKEGLAERARVDRAPYDLWYEQGYLKAAPGRAVDYEYVAGVLFDLFKRYNIRKLAFDRWNFAQFKPWLLRAGFTEAVLEEKFVECGQGYVSMTPALRALEAEILNARLAHGGHPVLTMCAANAVVITDDRMNRSLTKKKSHGRIDGMVALAMAMFAAPSVEERTPEYQAFII